MGRASHAITVAKQHGFHALADTSWSIPENNPLIIRARLLEIDVELFVYGPGRKKLDDNWKAGNWVQTLKAEINAIERSREQHWAALPSQDQQKFRIRAVQAERRLRDAQEEARMLKGRLKQGDGGQGAWVDEREALLANLRESAKAVEELQASESARMKKFEEIEARKVGAGSPSTPPPGIHFMPPRLLDSANLEWEAINANHEEQIRNLEQALEGARQDEIRAEGRLQNLQREMQEKNEELFRMRGDLTDAQRALNEISSRPAIAEKETEIEFMRRLVLKLTE